MDLKKGFDKAFKNIPAVNEERRFAEDCLEVYENCADHLNNNLMLKEISILFSFPILLQNKQKPITNSCRSNLWSKPILILSKTDFKILSKKPGHESFRVSFKFPRHRWDQRHADFNRFSNIETRRCYSCLVLKLHVLSMFYLNK